MNVLLTGGLFTYERLYKGKLDKVITKCTRVNPQSRYKNMSALRRGLFRAYNRPFMSGPAMFIYAYMIWIFLVLLIATLNAALR